MSDERMEIALDELEHAVEDGRNPILGPADGRAILDRIEAQHEVVEAAREFLRAELEYAGQLLKRIDVSEYGDINDQRISAAEEQLREALDNLEEQTDD